MKELRIHTLLLFFAILILLGILCYYKKGQAENLEQTLREPGHLAATVYRATNTILTATAPYSDAMDKLTLPAGITDAYNEWIDKGFVSPIKDQMLCGGCWAFATCSSLADRLTIATNGHWYPPFGLSEQILVSCGGGMGMDYYQGCDGGIPSFAIDALTKDGVPADSKCLGCGGGGQGGQGRGGGVVNPNTSTTCSSGGNVYASTNYTWWQTGCDGNTSCSLSAASTCPCAGVTSQMQNAQDLTSTPFAVKYKTIGQAHSYTSHGPNNEMKTLDLWPDIPQSVITANVERMKKAIYYEGPITIGYRVTQDFYTFWPTSNVDNYYRYDGRSPMAGGHAVVIVGWKKMKDGTPVWIVKNSWGANGGYGFPDGPKWTDPVSGKSELKYKGGFWNHVMGENDSFIESNSSGAHPDLSNPVISKFLPPGIPKNWNETMTLRDIYQQTAKIKGEPTPTPPKPTPPTPTPPKPTPTPPTPTPPPTEEPTPLVFTSPTFTVVTLTPDNINSQVLEQFFSFTKNLYMVGANDANNINKIIALLPNKSSLSEAEINTLIDKLGTTVQGAIVIAARGDTNNYYYLDGDPRDWKDIFSRSFLGRAATLKKFISEISFRFLSLDPQAPVVQLVEKNETFRWIT